MPKHKRFNEDEDYDSILFSNNDESLKDDGEDDSDDELIDEGSLVFKDCDKSDEEEDDAPESITFVDSRNVAIQKIKTALRQIGAQKSKVKEKRRKIDQQYKEQKKRKLEALEKEKLSDEFLQDLPEYHREEAVQRLKVQSDTNKPEKSHSSEDRLSFDDDEESFADTEEDFDQSEPVDFIPLDNDRLSGAVEVETLKQNKKKTLSSLERAKAFKDQQLYGSRIRRETTQSMLAKKQKRRARFK